eukprot:CAMPEP_0178440768 /NCGR_PEP_ID=MMETSP0689_2-20121128/36998_1 /TAXON_ID=160604 /ORGANISM="Amphidinium massartii, Strain CS-259" /LENGTH=364 /DNA_ID=CAMNT_0020063651 /DNA_START=32 /DNA_END=1126 /DNA_ORIENTATION=-
MEPLRSDVKRDEVEIASMKMMESAVLTSAQASAEFMVHRNQPLTNTFLNFMESDIPCASRRRSRSLDITQSHGLQQEVDLGVLIVPEPAMGRKHAGSDLDSCSCVSTVATTPRGTESETTQDLFQPTDDSAKKVKVKRQPLPPGPLQASRVEPSLVGPLGVAKHGSLELLLEQDNVVLGASNKGPLQPGLVSGPHSACIDHCYLAAMAWKESIREQKDLKQLCNEVKSAESAPTTVLLRNLPRWFHRVSLMDALDSTGRAGMYDYLHVPVHIGTGMCRGYAFVNFREAKHAAELMSEWHGSLMFCPPGGKHKKPLELSPSAVQGLQAILEHCRNKNLRKVANPRYHPFIAVDALSAEQQACLSC